MAVPHPKHGRKEWIWFRGEEIPQNEVVQRGAWTTNTRQNSQPACLEIPHSLSDEGIIPRGCHLRSGTRPCKVTLAQIQVSVVCINQIT